MASQVTPKPNGCPHNERPGPTLLAAAHANATAAVPALKEAAVSSPTTTSLRLLADFAGRWVGTGFSILSLPVFDLSQSRANPDSAVPLSRVKVNATIETLEFTPIGGTVPNRGLSEGEAGVGGAAATAIGQPDIFITGLSYLQQVSDFASKQALHIEPGLWLNIPATVVPHQPTWTVARLGTIPHGDALLARGIAFVAGKLPAGGLTVNGRVQKDFNPVIQDVSTTPTQGGTPLTPLSVPVASIPPGFKTTHILNPNLVLVEAIANQTIIDTTVIIISTANDVPAVVNPQPPPLLPAKDNPNVIGASLSLETSSAADGLIANIPVVNTNARASKLDATFWIETVQQSDGSTFLQLQYTQTVTLSFGGVDFPHIAVATLVKQ